MIENNTDYDENYETCSETYVTLRIYTKEINPNYVTNFFKIEPSEIIIKGEKRKTSVNGWFLSSEKQVKSKDSRSHFDWLINIIHSKKEKIAELKKKGFDIDISCYWISMYGMGGPTLSPFQLKNLSDLNIDVFFDFYGSINED